MAPAVESGTGSVPQEFTEDFIVDHSPPGVQPFAEFLSSPEPYRSINRRNTHMFAKDGYTIVDPSKNADSPTPGMDLEDDDLCEHRNDARPHRSLVRACYGSG